MAKSAEEVCSSDQALLPFPYDLPPPTYQKGGKLMGDMLVALDAVVKDVSLLSPFYLLCCGFNFFLKPFLLYSHVNKSLPFILACK